MRTMVTDFLENERMVTTVPKAKELRSVAEKMITLGKRETLHARRRALAFLRKKSVVFKLFDSLAPRFVDRDGGYTRILRLGPRPGDGAELALLEFVDSEAKTEPKGKGKARKETTKKAAKSESKTKAKSEKKTEPKKIAKAKVADEASSRPKGKARKTTSKSTTEADAEDVEEEG